MGCLLKHLTRKIKSIFNWSFDASTIILKTEVVKVKVEMDCIPVCMDSVNVLIIRHAIHFKLNL